MKNGYSICFNEWALDKDIKTELGLLLIISSLTAENGYCFASNKYFANLFEIDEVSVSRKISKLEKKKYISIEYEKRGAEVKNRKIRLTKMLTDRLQNNQSTINKNVKGNNTSINTTSNNKKIYKKENQVEEVFNYWNSKKIIVHDKITETIKKSINKFISNHSFELIKLCIDRYSTVLKDEKYFFKYKWALSDFLNRGSGAVDFLDGGSKWQNYVVGSKNNKPPIEKVDKTIIGGIRL